MSRPIVDERLCFVCQAEQPTFRATKGRETFLLCNDCKALVEAKNKVNNNVKAALRQQEYNQRPIFTQTLGGSLGSVTINFEKL